LELTPDQKRLEEQLRAWRKVEAAKTGKPAFLVCSDAALMAVVVACPQTIPELLTVSGFGKDKAERYGAEICAICRRGGRAATHAPEAPKAKTPSAEGGWRERAKAEAEQARLAPVRPVVRSETGITRSVGASISAQGVAVAKNAVVAPKEFKRERVMVQEVAAELNDAQKALEERLRAWRKAESEKMGLPQFFVLGTTALRSLVMERPKTLKELMGIQGIGQEKVDRYGAGILEVLNG
jgi:ATP-dependent DNA helicase RecQ